MHVYQQVRKKFFPAIKQFAGTTLLLGCLHLTMIDALAQTSLRFDFGSGEPAAPGFTRITPMDTLDKRVMYGFHTGNNLYAAATGHARDESDDFISSKGPFFFSVKLPDGNYNVKLRVGDAKGVADITVKAECRRFMVQRATTAKGEFQELLFTVHIRDSVIRDGETVKLKPKERSYLHWDNWLTLEFNGGNPKICAAEISKAEGIPTLFLAGNSTVVDQAVEPWAAWGQMFPLFLKPGKVAVANYAESGETLLAFKREKRLDKIWSLAKPGDYLFIEFAHNDQKPGGNHLDAFTTYSETIKDWIAECRRRSITPVLVTSMHRRRFDSTADTIINTLENYPGAMRRVAQDENVTLLDLNAMSKTLYEAWGPVHSMKAFVHYPANTYPNQPAALKDDTHFNAYGAYELAKCITQAIKTSSLPLKHLIADSFEGFEPSKPDAFNDVYLPASPFGELIKPDGN